MRILSHPQEATPSIPLHVEHTIARQHEGGDDPNLLCLACDRRNAYKGPNFTSIDPESGDVASLFNPQQDIRKDHFLLRGGEVDDLTPTGRPTARLLNMNSPRRMQLREEWLGEGGRL